MTDKNFYAPYKGQHCPAYTPITEGCYAIWVYDNFAKPVKIGNLNFRGNWMAKFKDGKYFPVIDGILMYIGEHDEKREF